MVIQNEWLCLDLLNTRGWEARDREDDELDSYERFIRWAERKGVVARREADRLVESAGGRSDQTAAILGRARELRMLLHRVFSHVAEGRLPHDEDLAVLEEVLAATGQRLALAEADDGGIAWQWSRRPAVAGRGGQIGGPGQIENRILGRIARSAADLLTSDGFDRVKVCGAGDCGWVFVDVSRNRSRRWCDMAGCGNRDKARRFRERHG